MHSPEEERGQRHLDAAARRAVCTLPPRVEREDGAVLYTILYVHISGEVVTPSY